MRRNDTSRDIIGIVRILANRWALSDSLLPASSIPEEQRRAVVEALKPVDEAILGYENVSFEDTIEILKPNIIALGYDQDVLEKTLDETIKEKGLLTKIVKIRRFDLSDLDSSSKIRKKIVEKFVR